LGPQGESAEVNEIIDFCKARMAAYKAPREIEFVMNFRKALPEKY